jgi:hypothetical protein
VRGDGRGGGVSDIDAEFVGPAPGARDDEGAAREDGAAARGGGSVGEDVGLVGLVEADVVEADRPVGDKRGRKHGGAHGGELHGGERIQRVAARTAGDRAGGSDQEDGEERRNHGEEVAISSCVDAMQRVCLIEQNSIQQTMSRIDNMLRYI